MFFKKIDKFLLFDLIIHMFFKIYKLLFAKTCKKIQYCQKIAKNERNFY